MSITFLHAGGIAILQSRGEEVDKSKNSQRMKLACIQRMIHSNPSEFDSLTTVPDNCMVADSEIAGANAPESYDEGKPQNKQDSEIEMMTTVTTTMTTTPITTPTAGLTSIESAVSPVSAASVTSESTDENMDCKMTSPKRQNNRLLILPFRRLEVREFNRFISCFLCGGYMINPTTLNNCMHTFCRSCIIQHIQKNKFCPICHGKQIGFSNLRLDQQLRNLIFKLVPGLYQNEQQRRTDFGNDNDLDGDIGGDFFSPDEPITLYIEYHPQSLTNVLKERIPPPRYLLCQAAVTVRILRKFICLKFDINPETTKLNVEIIYEDEILPEEFSLMDIGYCYHWNRTDSPMKLFYRILYAGVGCSRINENVNSASVSNSNDNNKEAKNSLKKSAEEANLRKVVRFEDMTDDESDVVETGSNDQNSSDYYTIPKKKNTQIMHEENRSDSDKKNLMFYAISKKKNLQNIAEKKLSRKDIGDYFGHNNNNVDCKLTKGKRKKKSSDDHSTTNSRKSMKTTGNEKPRNKKNKSVMKTSSQMSFNDNATVSSTINEIKGDFKSLRSNDIRYMSTYTNNTSNVTTSSPAKQKPSIVKAKLYIDLSTSPIKEELPKSDVKSDTAVVSTPLLSHAHRSSNSSDDSFENLSLAQLKTANKKMDTSPSECSQIPNDDKVNVEVNSESKLKFEIPKLKIELPSLKTKLSALKKSPEISESKKVPKIREYSIEEVSNPTTNQVDLATYAKNIGLTPINQILDEKKNNKVKSISDNSLSSSLSSSSPPSIGDSAFVFSSESGNFYSHKKRKKAKHSKESKEFGGSKRRKLHAEISSQPDDESLKLKVKITGNNKVYKAERKASGSSSDDVILISTVSSLPNTASNAVTTTVTSPMPKCEAEVSSVSASSTQDLKPARPKQGINIPNLNKALSEEASNINTLIKENSTNNQESTSKNVNVTQPALKERTLATSSPVVSKVNPASTVSTLSTANTASTVTTVGTLSTASTAGQLNPIFSPAKVVNTSMPPTPPAMNSLMLSVANSTQQNALKHILPKVMNISDNKIPISPPLPPSLFKTTPLTLQTITTTQAKPQTQTKVSSANDARNLAMSQLNRLTKVTTSRPQVNFAIPSLPRSLSHSPKLSSVTPISSGTNRQAAQLKRSSSLDGNSTVPGKRQKPDQDRLIKRPTYPPFLTKVQTTTATTSLPAKTQKNPVSTVFGSASNARILEPAYYAPAMAATYSHEVLARKQMPILLPPSSISVTKMSENTSSKIANSGLGVTITPQQLTPSAQPKQQPKPALEIVRISSTIPPIDQQPLTMTNNNNTVKASPPKTTRPPPPPIPLVKIKRSSNGTPLKSTLSTVNAPVQQQAKITHMNLSVAVSTPTTVVSNTSPPTLPISTAATKVADTPETSNNKSPPVCDNIGALDLSGKSSRSPSQEKCSPTSTPPQTPGPCTTTQQGSKEGPIGSVMNKTAVNSLEAAVNKLKQQSQFSTKNSSTSQSKTLLKSVSVLSNVEKPNSSQKSESSSTSSNGNAITSSGGKKSEPKATENQSKGQKLPEILPMSTNNLQNLKILSDSTVNREKVMIKNQRQLPIPKLNEINKTRPNTTVRQQNASVRNIPNPSALAFRSQQPIPMLASITKTSSQVKVGITPPANSEPSPPVTTDDKVKGETVLPSSSADTPLKKMPLTPVTSMKSEAICTVTSSVVSTTNVTAPSKVDSMKQTVTTTAKKNLNIDQLAASLRAAVAADSSSNLTKNQSVTKTVTTTALTVMKASSVASTTPLSVMTTASCVKITQIPATTATTTAVATTSSTAVVSTTEEVSSKPANQQLQPQSQPQPQPQLELQSQTQTQTQTQPQQSSEVITVSACSANTTLTTSTVAAASVVTN